MDDVEQRFEQLPDEVQHLITLCAQKDLRDLALEDLFETYFEKQLTPLGRTLLDDAIADRLLLRKDFYPFNGRDPQEVHGVLTDIRHPEHETVYQKDTLTLLLRLAALAVPGSALDEEVRGYIQGCSGSRSLMAPGASGTGCSHCLMTPR